MAQGVADNALCLAFKAERYSRRVRSRNKNQFDLHPDHDWIDFLPAGVDISLDTQRKWQQRRQLEQQHQHLTLVPMPGPQPQCYTVSAAAGLLAAAKPVTCAIQLPSVITLGASHR